MTDHDLIAIELHANGRGGLGFCKAVYRDGSKLIISHKDANNLLRQERQRPIERIHVVHPG